MSATPHTPARSIRLPALRLPGIVPDVLGMFLVGLGLARIVTRRWPLARTAWRDGALTFVGGPETMEELAAFLDEVGANGGWTPYERAWKAAQEAEAKRKEDEPSPVAVWQAHEADEVLAQLSRAHLIEAGGKRRFNRLLGTGGNTGRREFPKGWAAARDAIVKSYAKPPKRKTPVAADDLRAFLKGGSCALLSDWGAASWFTVANKVANSGQTGYGGGQLTPWAMTLACEGLPLFAGGASRRLGASSHLTGAFPFVTRAAAPTSFGEAGLDTAEVWAPIWDAPMTFMELEALFARGRAEVSGRAASTPGAFATAIVKRGVDAGIARFQRFVLGQTTSANTFESRLAGTVELRTSSGVRGRTADADAAVNALMEAALGLLNSLPEDKKEGTRWRFRGLRGPVEAAMVGVAEAPSNAERVGRLLDEMAGALDTVDRTRAYREEGVRVALCEPTSAMLDLLFGGSTPPVEARLAMSVASMGWDTGASPPALTHRFGVAVPESKPRRGGRWQVTIPKIAPHAWIWRTTSLVENLGAMVRRRLANLKAQDALPFDATVSVPLADVDEWLAGSVDEAEITRWIGRFMLFRWDQRRSHFAVPHQDPTAPLRGRTTLYGLFRAISDPRPLEFTDRDGVHKLLVAKAGSSQQPRSVLAARRVTALLAGGDVEQAWSVAASRFAMTGQRLVDVNAPMASEEADRILAALAFAPSPTALAKIVHHRWVRPVRRPDNRDHQRKES